MTEQQDYQPPTTPLTKQESRKQNDKRATSIYRRRTQIDRWHEQRAFEKSLEENWK